MAFLPRMYGLPEPPSASATCANERTRSNQPFRIAGTEDHQSGNWKTTRSAARSFSSSAAMSGGTALLESARRISMFGTKRSAGARSGKSRSSSTGRKPIR